ncbi:GspH/FimT family pseudopilin [Teredinibacter franksiae]|jgi:prepilin-type N-terminal cleavage/methylation domain|uniref:GspH/FimT family pseudopilin n=1 Tax=Teredinibacter franksiae TaxID=2761453 RepID=UPI0016256A48|nr:GspH/FimT family pseudopilin [Teredinibacter franksiae]
MFYFHSQRGMTLPELMMGIALFAILVSMAVPSFEGMMRRQELNAQLGLLNSTLAFARNQAITRKEDVTFCGTADGATCTTSSNWSAGWLVFVDENSNGNFDVGELVLRSGGEDGGQAKLNVVSAVPLSVRYQASGESETGVSTLYLCAGNAETGADTSKSRTLTVSRVGSTRVAKGATCP